MTDTKAALPPAAPADQPPKSMGPIGRTLAKIRRWRANKFSREQPLQARIDTLKIRKALCEDAKADVINQLCAQAQIQLDDHKYEAAWRTIFEAKHLAFSECSCEALWAKGQVLRADAQHTLPVDISRPVLELLDTACKERDRLLKSAEEKRERQSKDLESLARCRFEIEGMDHPASIANYHVAHAIEIPPALADDNAPRYDLSCFDREREMLKPSAVHCTPPNRTRSQNTARRHGGTVCSLTAQRRTIPLLPAQRRGKICLIVATTARSPLPKGQTLQ
jgi:hypothetical protein